MRIWIYARNDEAGSVREIIHSLEKIRMVIGCFRTLMRRVCGRRGRRWSVRPLRLALRVSYAKVRIAIQAAVRYDGARTFPSTTV